MNSTKLMDLAKITYEHLLIEIPGLADSIKDSSIPLDSSRYPVLGRFGQMLKQLLLQEQLRSDDLTQLMKEFTQLLEKHKISIKSVESKLKQAISENSLPNIEPHFNKLDLNAVRKGAAIFKAARESFETQVDGECSTKTRNDLQFGTQIIVDQLNASEISDVMVQHEVAIRTMLIFENLPAVESWIIGPPELETRLKEIKAAEPLCESIRRPDELLNPNQPLPVKWAKVIRGGGLASANILFGTLAIYGVHRETGIGRIEPSAWQAVLSIYAGIFDIHEGFAGK